MLELRDIKKEYPAGENTVYALKGVTLDFRKNEFVAILGPSGCGKTTMLNIIGGLDHYTEGDLIINGKSTKDFTEREWDAYRNHSIGFVFQSYNLIPHQTVLQNVELALALSGVSKSERRERAKEALRSVGLETQLHKKPTEMSGGQMQRVAIARALVNNPDIILADEPTGALDSETSVQVMDILKEVSKDRLVIMVTHNPELAEKYATRTVRMIDGRITDDTAPLSDGEKEREHALDKEAAEQEMQVLPNGKKKPKKQRKPSMSLWTSFCLSLKNLFTKKGRTLLTSFAGSIGIIGIALIYAVSQGMTNYINIIQEETLSSYPLAIQSEHTDMTSFLQSFMEAAKSSGDHSDEESVYEKTALYDLVKAFSTRETKQNDLKSFKEFIESERTNGESASGLSTALAGVQYTYDFDMLIYTENVDGTIMHSDMESLVEELMTTYLGSAAMSTLFSSSMFSSSMTLWQEMLSGNDGSLINPMLKKQYDLVYGDWPNEYNEILLVVDEKNEIDDMTLYALGLKSEEEIAAMANAAINNAPLPETEAKHWTYKEICEDMKFRTVLGKDCYIERDGVYHDLRSTDEGLKYLYDKGFDLKVSGIIRPNEDASSTMLTGSICYTYKLTEHIVAESEKAAATEGNVLHAQLANPNTDVFTGLPFKEGGATMTDEEKAADFKEYITSLDTAGKADAYVKIQSVMPAEQLNAAVAEAMKGVSRDEMVETMTQALVQQMGMDEATIRAYVSEMSEEELTQAYTQLVAMKIQAGYAVQVQAGLQAVPDEQKASLLDEALPKYTNAQCAVYYDNVLTFSEDSYEGNLQKLGYVDLATPSSVSLYASSFENKGVIKDAIKAYNKRVGEEKEINYTDYVDLMMSSVTKIIDAITYVLIAFVAVSLIVSSIMIGVITLISVQERTKEIGILRAIGASKRNVSSMFNAETLIIGFSSGALGVIVTYLLCLPINGILHLLTGIGNLNAYLPIETGLILIGISMLLTLIAGIIPSRSAAKKDPVVALRSE